MTTSTGTVTDVDVVRAVFGAFASGDLAALSDLLHADATWHHHNDDLANSAFHEHSGLQQLRPVE